MRMVRGLSGFCVLIVLAVSTAAQDNIVIDVVKPGYQVGHEVLRPANVTVGKYEENPE